jgi:hypothetical protein
LGASGHVQQEGEQTGLQGVRSVQPQPGQHQQQQAQYGGGMQDNDFDPTLHMVMSKQKQLRDFLHNQQQQQQYNEWGQTRECLLLLLVGSSYISKAVLTVRSDLLYVEVFLHDSLDYTMC